MAALIYLLCTATALLCSALLLRGYRRIRVPFLLWSGLCFSGIALENLVLFLDRIVFLSVDLSPVRQAAGLVAVSVLLYGLIWKEKK